MSKKISGETYLNQLLKTLKPLHNRGNYVFCEVNDLTGIDLAEIVMTFREGEAITIIIKKELADSLKLSYSYVAAWITLTVHSSLSAVGLTAAFSKALSEKGISCNVVAAFYHDHIFVERSKVHQAMEVLRQLSNGGK